jgi:hypothetical protein
LLARFAFALETRLIQGTYPQAPSLGMPGTDRGHAGQDGHGGRWWRHARIAARQRPRVSRPWPGMAAQERPAVFGFGGAKTPITQVALGLELHRILRKATRGSRNRPGPVRRHGEPYPRRARLCCLWRDARAALS